MEKEGHFIIHGFAVTPLIPNSSAIITAAFSPMAIAVLYVLAATFEGVMLQSIQEVWLSTLIWKRNFTKHTGNL